METGSGFTDFIAQRRDAWEELAGIVGRASTARGVRRLAVAELRRLGPLYQQAAADLAYARLRGAPEPLLEYLNALVVRSHGLVYADRRPGSARVKRFFAIGLPRLLRANIGWIATAAALFVAGGALGALLQLSDPRYGHALLGERADELSFYKDLATTTAGTQASMSAALMQNNIRVAILAFACGMLGAVPTLIILFANGLPIGALGVIQTQTGYGPWFWSFLAPHGVPELSAIFIAGAAGMRIGHALVAPGELPRRDALRIAGGVAIRLLAGATALLVIAGLTEAFVSPSALPFPIKYAYAALLAVLLTVYARLGISADRSTS